MGLKHIKLFKSSGVKLSTSDGLDVELVNLINNPNPDILSDWALHIRKHYCQKEEIDDMCAITGLTQTEFLRNIKLPDDPKIISGDFAEILIADYLQFVLNYIAPRTRYETKINKNTSPNGIDILAFKILTKVKYLQKMYYLHAK